MQYNLLERDKQVVEKILYIMKLSAKPSINPIVHFIVAPPGAGKTGLEVYLNNEMVLKNEDSVKVGSDKLATYHPEYSKWLRLLPDECYSISRNFTIPASEIIYEDLRKEKINMLFEKTFHKGNEDLEFVKKFKEAGYEVIINVMATDKYESILSCHERDIKAAEIGIIPRPVSRKNFNKMYSTFLSEIISMENMHLCDKIGVFTRGKKMYKPNLIYTSGDSSYMNAYQAVEEERRKQRKKLYSPNDSIAFQERINKAIIDTENFIDNDEIKKQSIKDLEQLQCEFIQELSYSYRTI